LLLLLLLLLRRSNTLEEEAQSVVAADVVIYSPFPYPLQKSDEGRSKSSLTREKFIITINGLKFGKTTGREDDKWYITRRKSDSFGSVGIIRKKAKKKLFRALRCVRCF